MFDLVRSLAVAWKHVAAYPAGHPALLGALDNAERQLAGPLAGTGQISLGVLRDGFLTQDRKIDFPHAQELASALHKRGVSLLRLRQGLERAELETFLRLLAAQAPETVLLAEELAHAGIAHVELESVDFSGVRVTDDLQAPPAAPPSKPSSLSEAIVRALMEGQSLSTEGRRLATAGALTEEQLAWLVADCLRQDGAAADGTGGAGGGTGGGTGGGAEGGTGGGTGGGAGLGVGSGEAPGTGGSASADLGGRLGDAVLGYLASLHGGGGQRDVADQIVRFARSLPMALRESIVTGALRALAGDEAAGEALAQVARGFEPDMVMRAFQRLQATRFRMSSHALRFLQSLAASAEPQPSSEAFDLQFVRELSTLLREDDVDRYLPESHQQLLEYVTLDLPPAPEAPAAEREALRSSLEEDVTTSLALGLLEVLGHRGTLEGFEKVLDRMEQQFRRLIELRRLDQALAVAEAIRELRHSRSSVEMEARLTESQARLASADCLRLVVDALQRTGSEHAELARRLVDSLGAAAIRSLLLTLAEEKDQTRRRRVFDLLTSLGPAVVGHARLLLSDARWYVVRNMLALLRRVADRGSLEDVRKLAEHPDLRVRLEAIKNLFEFDPQVPAELLARAIHDPDPKLAEAAITLAGSYGIAEAVAPLLALLEPRDFLGRRRLLRLKAIKSLGELAVPSALPRLERFFSNSWLSLVNREERRAAYQSLAGYPPEARRPYVERGLRSRDDEIRDASDRLAKLDAVRESAPEGPP